MNGTRVVQGAASSVAGAMSESPLRRRKQRGEGPLTRRKGPSRRRTQAIQLVASQAAVLGVLLKYPLNGTPYNMLARLGTSWNHSCASSNNSPG